MYTQKRSSHPNPVLLSLAVCCLLILTLMAAFAHGQSGATNSPDDDKIVADFGSRVKSYVESRKKAGGTAKPTKESAELAKHKKETKAKVRSERADAKQGDIFAPEIAAYFRRQLAAALTGPKGGEIRASLRHAEPVAPVPLKVNESYPAGLALQSTPPSLLLNLPRLPKGLEYRIVGHDLVLHDSVTNLIVDLIPDALPNT